MRGQVGDVAPVQERRRPRIRRDPPGQQADQRRLARAVRPDQRVDLPRGQVEIHPVTACTTAKAPCQTPRLDRSGQPWQPPVRATCPTAPAARTAPAAPAQGRRRTVGRGQAARHSRSGRTSPAVPTSGPSTVPAPPSSTYSIGRIEYWIEAKLAPT